MAVSPSIFGICPQFENSAGEPAVGDKLFFYVAGSNTKQDTFTSSTGLTANTNPIVLNSLGQPSTEIWWTVGQLYKMVWAPSTDTDPPSNPIRTFDNLSGITTSSSTTSTQDEWVLYPAAPTYVSATSFTVTGNQTATFNVGRRVKTTNTAGTIYSSITNSVFGAVTTVTVVNDSGVLDAGLSDVSYGLLSASNPSVPATYGRYASTDRTSISSGTVDAITVAFTPAITTFDNGPIWWRAAGANTSTTPTLKRDGLAAKTIVKGNNLPLVAGDIAGAGEWMCSTYDVTLDKEVLLNFSKSIYQYVVQIVEATPYATVTATTTVIPYDDTIPQITEGVEVMTVSITPKSTTNRLRISFLGNFGSTSSTEHTTVALFQDSTANALTAVEADFDGNVHLGQAAIEYEMAAGTTSATTFRIRFGPGAGTSIINGISGSARKYGGVMAARLSVTEITA
jgi:hypothetical protein